MYKIIKNIGNCIVKISMGLLMALILFYLHIYELNPWYLPWDDFENQNQ